MQPTQKLNFVNEIFLFTVFLLSHLFGGRHGRDPIVVGFTTTYVISAYHH